MILTFLEAISFCILFGLLLLKRKQSSLMVLLVIAEVVLLFFLAGGASLIRLLSSALYAPGQENDYLSTMLNTCSSQIPPFVCRMIYNKPVAYAGHAAIFFLVSFSTENLFPHLNPLLRLIGIFCFFIGVFGTFLLQRKILFAPTIITLIAQAFLFLHSQIILEYLIFVQSILLTWFCVKGEK